MMRKLIWLFLAVPLMAQVSPPSTQSRVAGRFVAWNYGQWSLPVYEVPSGTGSKTFTLSNSTVTLSDGRRIMPFNTNAQIYLGTEKLTITAVGAGCILGSTVTGGCSLTATFSSAHTNADQVTSATFGLQEALNDAGSAGGGVVTVDSAWTNLGGTDAMLAAATIPTSTGIEYARTGSPATPKYVASSGAIAVNNPNTYVTCTTTCTVTPLAPAPGVQLCVDNAPGVTTAITLAALGASKFYSLTDNSAYGTANHTFVSGGAATDAICIVGLDSTHYKTKSSTGTWTD